MADYILEAKHITKRFAAVVALNDVNFNVKQGEVHVLCGENGAGKSTLMNVISGVFPYGNYEGELYFNDELCKFRNIKDSEKLGIAVVHQQLALIPELSIAENIFLGNEYQSKGKINWNKARKQTRKLLKKIGLNESPDTPIKSLAVGKRQLVEICKALSKDVKLLILDEPTSALNEEESQNLLKLVEELREDGISTILISHKIYEVTDICNTLTVLRDGQTISSFSKEKEEITENKIITAMVGREMSNLYPERESNISDEVIFEIKNWNVFHPHYQDKQVINDVSIKAYKGEVVGIAGLMGSGRTELAMSVFGKNYGQKISGELYINGEKKNIKTAKDAINFGLSYVSEDRHDYGLINGLSVKDNITLAALDDFIKGARLDKNREVVIANEYKSKLNIKCQNVEQSVDALSGGNQQKVILSRWILCNPEILILDEPTRGIDVGSKYEIYEIINNLVDEGKSVVFISSDMLELIGMCDRVYVLNEGKIAGELLGDSITQYNIMETIIREGGQQNNEKR